MIGISVRHWHYKPTSKITINPGSLDPCGHLSWLVESLSRDSVLGRNWTILMPAQKILKNCPPFFIFKNSERVLRIDIGRWKFQKFIITYLSLPRKNWETQLQLLLPLNFAYAKKLLVKRAIFVLLFEGTNFLQKFISISKNWPRLMKLSESHKDISELVWKKFGWWHLIPSWPEFCVLLFFTPVFGCFVTLDLGIWVMIKDDNILQGSKTFGNLEPGSPNAIFEFQEFEMQFLEAKKICWGI